MLTVVIQNNNLIYVLYPGCTDIVLFSRHICLFRVLPRSRDLPFYPLGARRLHRRLHGRAVRGRRERHRAARGPEPRGRARQSLRHLTGKSSEPFALPQLQKPRVQICAPWWRQRLSVSIATSPLHTPALFFFRCCWPRAKTFTRCSSATCRPFIDLSARAKRCRQVTRLAVCCVSRLPSELISPSLFPSLFQGLARRPRLLLVNRAADPPRPPRSDADVITRRRRIRRLLAPRRRLRRACAVRAAARVQSVFPFAPFYIQPASTCTSAPNYGPLRYLAGELYLFGMLHQAVRLQRPSALAPGGAAPLLRQWCALTFPLSLLSMVAPLLFLVCVWGPCANKYIPRAHVHNRYVEVLSDERTQIVLRGASPFGPLAQYFIAP